MVTSEIPQTLAGIWHNRYNTVEGISKLVATLEGFKELARERHRVRYGYGNDRTNGDRINLNPFIILGRWHTDSCGNMSPIKSDFIPKEKFADFPDVLEWEKFWQFCQDRGLNKNEVHIGCYLSSSRGHIPSPHLVCAHCGKPWSIKNCHDVVSTNKEERISLAPYVGWTLEQVKARLNVETLALYFFTYERFIRNDRFIDLTPEKNYPTLKVNEFGWTQPKDGITGTYVVQPGDEGGCTLWQYRHHACHLQNQSQLEESYFRKIFTDAGVPILNLSEIPNEYSQGDYYAPWYLIMTRLGVIKIGWRKRVINIDWSQTGRNFLPLFADEGVTKDAHSIHAGGTEKAVEYLKKMHEAQSS